MDELELCGWIGAILVLVAYHMVSTGKSKAHSKYFQLLNIAGAIFLVTYTYNLRAYASMAVNVIWVGIGMSSFIIILNLSNLLLKRKVLMTTKTKLITAVFSALLLLSSNASISQEVEYSESNTTNESNYDEATDEETNVNSEASDETVDATESDEDYTVEDESE